MLSKWKIKGIEGYVFGGIKNSISYLLKVMVNFIILKS